MKKRHQQKLVILSIGLVFALNLPLLFMFNEVDAVMGIPLMYLYIFGVWLLSIIITYVVLKRYA
ncbi:hypothetical protein BST97_02055 [Nonlabens spongiae]|uniref:DUF3311 domain-containing protein n=1 Tax=Nonlabens spongiae TaxID=331648 RepID=A0A1W6MH27_9FLAO|nr:hypothetical protein [Nonlabens spongiae]ARN76880.1 hypothetical protein BST97_02055 [Nonlabens spongiae]